MAEFTMQQIAEITQGTILAGDGNRVIKRFSTNSKDGDEFTLFVPIKGERVDAHNFIADAYMHGILCTFTTEDKVREHTDGMTYIKVPNCVAALQKIGEDYRSHFDIPLIGITGSVGKTTTREMIAAALETKLCILKTEKNMNSQVGLPQMMAKLEAKHQAAVIEMGMSEFGEMSRIAKVAKPTSAVITNIGVSHIGQLKTKENIRSEKANICNYFTKDSILLVNGDDPLLRELYDAFSNPLKDDKEKTQICDRLNLAEETKQHLKQATVVTYGTTPDCTVYADEITTDGYTTVFQYHYEDSNHVKQSEKITLSVLGQHNVQNAMAALFIASMNGINPSTAKLGLRSYQPVSMRGQIEQIRGITVVDDTYNASPDSMKGAIDICLSLPKEGKKIVIFADILELGEISEQSHYEVGRYLAEKSSVAEHATDSVDWVVTYGTEAKQIVKAINNYNKKIHTLCCDTKEEVEAFLTDTIKEHDTLLLKGSRGMQLETLIEFIKKG